MIFYSQTKLPLMKDNPMKKTIITLILFALAVHVLAGVTNLADKNKPSSKQVPPKINEITAAEQRRRAAASPTNYTFVNETWTKSNQPYHALRIKVDHALAAGQKPDDLLPAAKAAAQAKPNDPKAQFLWAYIAYQARIIDYKQALLQPDRASQQATALSAIRKLEGVREALARIPFTHAYDYSRIHFLVAANTEQGGEQIEPLGLRLLHHNPMDYAVESTVVGLLQPGVVPGDMELGLSLIKSRIRHYPTLLGPREEYSGWYQKYWSGNGFHRADADRAIAEIHALEKILPTNSPLRQNAILDIQHIQQIQDFEEQQRREKKTSSMNMP